MIAIDPSHKSQNASDKYLTMGHFVTGLLSLIPITELVHNDCYIYYPGARPTKVYDVTIQ